MKYFRVTLEASEVAEIKVRAKDEEAARADALTFAKYLDWHSRETESVDIEEIPPLTP